MNDIEGYYKIVKGLKFARRYIIQDVLGQEC